MKVIMFLFLSVFVLGFMPQDSEKEVKLNQEFSLHFNEQSHLTSEKLRIKFLEVLEDSRCPEGVDCIWEGNGKVEIKITESDGKFKVIELNTDVEPTRQTVEDYEIKMVKLEPRPRSNVEIKKKSYTISLQIYKRQEKHR